MEATERERQRRKEQSQEAARLQLQKEAQQRSRAGQGGNRGPLIDSEGRDMGVDDDDEGDAEEAERAVDEWKLREIRRIQRDQRRRAALDRARQGEEGREEDGEEEERLRLSSVDADSASAAALPSDVPPPPSGRYLQRYFHVGAFFADERQADAAIFSRDFQQPTGEDRTIDRSLLPQVMQVKHFGRKGRTKYTTLTQQDTSRSPYTHDSRTLTAREVGVRGFQGAGKGG